MYENQKTILIPLVNKVTDALGVGIKYFFEPNNFLTGKEITGIQIFPSELTNNTIAGTSANVVFRNNPAGGNLDFTITLVDEAGELVIQNMPLSSLEALANVAGYATNANTKRNIFSLKKIKLDRSYITCATLNAIAINAGIVVVFNYK